MLKKSIILSLFIALLSTTFILRTPIVQAQITNPVTGSFGEYSQDTTSGAQFVGYFVNIWAAVTTVGGLAVILFMIWGAFDWITAGGDTGKIGKARDKMTNAVIGLILLVSTFVIIGFVGRLFFGEEFDILKLDIPGLNNAANRGPGAGSNQPGIGIPTPVQAGQCVSPEAIDSFICASGETFTDRSCAHLGTTRCKFIAPMNGSCFNSSTTVCEGVVFYDTTQQCTTCSSGAVSTPRPATPIPTPVPTPIEDILP
jgi:hypothetical protein